jgi:N12 class adenine-specific DNA methylase
MADLTKFGLKPLPPQGAAKDLSRFGLKPVAPPVQGDGVAPFLPASLKAESDEFRARMQPVPTPGGGPSFIAGQEPALPPLPGDELASQQFPNPMSLDQRENTATRLGMGGFASPGAVESKQTAEEVYKLQDLAMRQNQADSGNIKDWKQEDWDKYHNEMLPIPLDSYAWADKEVLEQKWMANELITGRPLAGTPKAEKKARQELIDTHRDIMQVLGMDNAVTYTMQYYSKRGAQWLPARWAEAGWAGLKEGTKSITAGTVGAAADFAGQTGLIDEQTAVDLQSSLGVASGTKLADMEAQGWLQGVEAQKDKRSPIGEFASSASVAAAKTLGQMAPSIALGGVVGAVSKGAAAAGAITAGEAAAYTGIAMQVGSDTYNQMRAEGNNWAVSLSRGIEQAAKEALTEIAGGAVANKLGVVNLEGALTGKAFNIVRNAIEEGGVTKLLAKASGSMASEGLEEVAADIIDMTLGLINGEEFDPKRLPFTFTVGALAGLAGHVPAVAEYLINPSKKNQAAAKIPEDVARGMKARQALADEVNGFLDDYTALREKQAQEAGQNPPPQGGVPPTGPTGPAGAVPGNVTPESGGPVPTQPGPAPGTVQPEQEYMNHEKDAWEMAESFGVPPDMFMEAVDHFQPQTGEQWAELVNGLRDAVSPTGPDAQDTPQDAKKVAEGSAIGSKKLGDKAEAPARTAEEQRKLEDAAQKARDEWETAHNQLRLAKSYANNDAEIARLEEIEKKAQERANATARATYTDEENAEEDTRLWDESQHQQAERIADAEWDLETAEINLSDAKTRGADAGAIKGYEDAVAKADAHLKSLKEKPAESGQKPDESGQGDEPLTVEEQRTVKIMSGLEADQTPEERGEVFASAGYTNVDGLWVHPDVDPEWVSQLKPETKQAMKDRGIFYLNPQVKEGSDGGLEAFQHGVKGVLVRTEKGNAQGYTRKDNTVLHEIGHHVWLDELTDEQREEWKSRERVTKHGKDIAEEKGNKKLYTKEDAAEEDFAQSFAENGADLDKTLNPPKKKLGEKAPEAEKKAEEKPKEPHVYPADLSAKNVVRIQKALDKAVPKAGMKVVDTLSKEDGREVYRVESPNGEHFHIVETDSAPLSEDELLYNMNAYGWKDTPENRAEFLDGWRGAFYMRKADGSLMSGMGAITLKTRLSNGDLSTTLRHELIHMAVQTGMMTQEEFDALAKAADPKATTSAAKQEAIATSTNNWGLEGSLTAKLQDMLDMVLEMLGISDAKIKEIQAKMRSGEILLRPTKRLGDKKTDVPKTETKPPETKTETEGEVDPTTLSDEELIKYMNAMATGEKYVPPAKVEEKPAEPAPKKKLGDKKVTIKSRTGRSMPMYPTVSGTMTYQQVARAFKAQQQWLLEQAIEEAFLQHNDLLVKQIQSEKAGHIPPAKVDDLLYLVFGNNPPQNIYRHLEDAPRGVPKANKPEAPKPPKTPLAEKAKEARDEAGKAFDDFKDAIKDLGLFSGPPLNPKAINAANTLAVKLFKAGTLTFAEFIEKAIKEFGPEIVGKLGPYLEQAWSNLGIIFKGKVDAAGSVASILEKKNEKPEQQEHPPEQKPGVADGPGQPGTDETAVSGESTKGGEAEGDGGRKGEKLLPDADGAPEAVPGGTAGEPGGEGASGPTAGESELAGGETADGSGASDAPKVPRGVNHVIEPGDTLAVSSPKKSYKANVDAIRLLKQLEKEDREATTEEKKVLAHFTGWGGLSNAFNKAKAQRAEMGGYGRDANWENEWLASYKELKELLTEEEWQAARSSTINAHYTSRPVIEQMWSLVQRLGFQGGRVLEPGAGIGHFAGLTPESLRSAVDFTMVEMDDLSARMLKKLYPQADVQGDDFGNVNIAPGSHDLVIGNVPFDDQVQADAERRYGMPLNLHNYFIARSIDAVKPGGLVVVISTAGTLDNKPKERKFLAEKADLVGAIRLPETTFEGNAKTSVITDILVFRRKSAERYDGESFISTKPVPGLMTKSTLGGPRGTTVIPPVPIKVNEYFINHPDMVMGRHSNTGSMYRSGSYNVESTGDLKSQVTEAVGRFPANIALGTRAEGETVVAKAEEKPRVGTLKMDKKHLVVAVKDGWLRVGPGTVAPEGFPKSLFTNSGVKRAPGYMKIRDAYKSLREIMLDPASTEADVAAAQAILTSVYEKYIAKHGKLNEAKTRIFRMDPEYYRVLSLENKKVEYNSDTDRLVYTYTPASVFTKRTLGPRIAPVSAANLQDALWISLGYKGRIDPEYIGSLIGVSADAAQRGLANDGLAYMDPATQELTLKARYLSGNVKKKLREAEIAAEADSQYDKNVEDLKAIQPARVSVSDTKVHLGANWIPSEIATAFARDVMENSTITATYMPEGDMWVMAGQTFGKAMNDYAVRKSNPQKTLISGIDILDYALNLSNPRITYIEKTGELTPSGKEATRTVFDEKATIAVKGQIKRLQKEFVKYVKDHQAAGNVLEDVYNEKFNAFVDATFDGSHLELPGSNADIVLRPYQKNAIWRMIQDGYALLAHAVGAGKTYTMIGAAMEMKRLKLANRPMLVVQNSTLGQFANSFMKMYPDANVLVATKDDLNTKNRHLFLARITSGDWDAVVMAQSTFDGLVSSPGMQNDYIQAALSELEDTINDLGGDKKRNNTPTVKELVRQRNALQKKLDDLLAKQANDADKNLVYFDELGVDALFLDEAHAYKKPFFVTKMNALVGLNKQASAKGVNTMVKIRGIQDENGGKNVFLATGTPITNTLGEAWHMTNFVSPKTNREFNVRTFDGFVGTFALQDTIYEKNAGGQLVARDALVRYVNGPEIVRWIRDSWDILTPDQLRSYMDEQDLGLPKWRGGDMQAISAERTPGVKKMMRFIQQVYVKYQAMEPKDRRELSYIPAVAYGAMKAASLDIRLVMPDAKAEEGSNVDHAVKLMWKEYQDSTESKGTQIIFSDIFNHRKMDTLYQFMAGEPIDLNMDAREDTEEEEREAEAKSFLFNDIKKRLIALGVPADEIGIAAEFNTPAKWEGMIERFKTGNLRFLMGHSERIGTGVDFPQKIVAIHHLDTPWLPAHVEQRNGRGIRNGNENAFVAGYRYAMKETLDAAIFMNTIRKGKLIWQVMAGKLTGREFDDPSSALTFSMEQQLAEINGSPLDREKLEKEVTRRELAIEKEATEDAKARNRETIKDNEKRIKELKNEVIPDQKAMLEEIKGLLTPGMSVTIGDKTYTDRKEVDAAVKALVDAHVADIQKEFHKGHKGWTWKPGWNSRNTALSNPGSLSEPFTVNGLTVNVYADAWQETATIEGKTGVVEKTMYGFAVTVPSRPTTNIYDGDAQTGAGLADQISTRSQRMEAAIDSNEKRVENLEKENVGLQEVIDRPWDGQEQLDELIERLAQIEQLQVAESAAEAAEIRREQEQFRQEQERREKERKEREGDGDASADSLTAPYAPGSPPVNAPPPAGTQPSGVKSTLGKLPVASAIGNLKGIPAPEMLMLAREILQGDWKVIVKRLRRKLGMFAAYEGMRDTTRILLNPSIGANEYQFAATLAHEMGHLIDYLPDGTLKRGNLIGRILALRKFMRGSHRLVKGKKNELRKELMNLSKWWRGDWAEDGSGYDKYRRSDKELFADALSVLLNSPGELEAKAPKFFAAFTHNLNRRPDVLQAYLEIQHLLNGSPMELAASRSERLTQMAHGRGDEALRMGLNAIADANRNPMRAIEQYFEQHFLGAGAPIRARMAKAKKAGAVITDQTNAYYVLEELATMDSPNFIMMQDIKDQFHDPVMKMGFTRRDINEYLVMRRIVNDRGEILNPLGFTPSAATAQLAAMKDRLGDKQFQKLEGAIGIWHDIIFERAKAAVAAGVYSRKNFYEKIVPNKDNYATFAVIHFLENSPTISAGIKQQIGTISDIMDAYDATNMKTITLNRLIEFNKTKASLRDFLRKYYPKDCVPVNIPYGESEPSHPPKKGYEYMIVLEDGKPKAYEVPENIAKSMASHDLGSLKRAMNIVNSKIHSIWYPLYVSLSINWQAANLPRDLLRTWHNLASIGDANYKASVKKKMGAGKTKKEAKQESKGQKISFRQVLVAYAKALGPARAYAMQLHLDSIDNAISNRILDSPYAELDVSALGDTGMTEYLIKSYGLRPAPQKGFKKAVHDYFPDIYKLLAGSFDFVQKTGKFMEAVPKLAADDLLKQRKVGARKRSFHVRKHAGTPDSRQKGLWTPLTNTLWMFQRVRLVGLFADLGLATSSIDKTGAAWWWRTVVTSLAPTTLTKLTAYGAAGVFGKGVQEMLTMIPTYFLDNFIVIPLGWVDGGDDEDKRGKVVFAAIPKADTDRIVGSISAKAMDIGLELLGHDVRPGTAGDIGMEIGDEVLSSTIGTFTPPLDIALKWAEYGAGGIPRDSHYKTDIIRRNEWQAGGWEAMRPMLSWTVSKFGIASTIAHPLTEPILGNSLGESKDQSKLETTIRSTPGVSRIIKVTDRGKTDRQWAAINAADAEQARFKLGLDGEVRGRTTERSFLQQVAKDGEITQKEADDLALLNKWYNDTYLPITEEMKNGDRSREKELTTPLKDYLGPVAVDRAKMALHNAKRPDLGPEETQAHWEARTADWKRQRDEATQWLLDNKTNPVVKAATKQVVEELGEDGIRKFRFPKPVNGVEWSLRYDTVEKQTALYQRRLAAYADAKKRYEDLSKLFGTE